MLIRFALFPRFVSKSTADSIIYRKSFEIESRRCGRKLSFENRRIEKYRRVSVNGKISDRLEK